MDPTCIGNNQQQQQQVYHHHAEYNLLFDTLKNIWQNYLQAFNNVDVKQHWLQLFLFNFQFVSEELLENEEFKSFFNPIPEELCSFLLEQIYEIISKSDLYIPSVENFKTTETSCDNYEQKDIDEKQTSEKNKQFLQLLKKNHNFAQLILKQPSDCSKIIALRQFLTHQLGQHLLEFLLRVDIKLVASQKSLCNLCINLFPNCPWWEHYRELSNQQDIFAFIGNLQLYQKFKCKSNNNVSTNNKDTVDLSNRGMDNFQDNDCFEEFLQATKTSDEIALILIQLLIKCIENERFSPLHSDQSMFMLTLNFSLDCLSVENQAFSSSHNAEVIKCYLLKLNEQCLNNLFALTDNSLNDIQFQCIFAKLIAALECNLQTTRLLYALIYIIFAILHNVVAIYSQKTLWNAKVNLYNLKFIDENIIDCCLSTMEHLLRHQPPEQDDIKSLYHLIFRTLLKIIENLNKYDMMISTISNNYFSNTNPSSAKPGPVRYRKLKTKQMHCLSSVPKLSCYFQNMLITILPTLPKDLQEQSMLYLARSGLCCCHYNLALFNNILNIIFNITAYYQKCAYKFLYYKMLNTIFLKSPLENSSAPQSSVYQKRSGIYNCMKCDLKLKSVDFHQGLLEIYKTFYTKLQTNNEHLTNLIYFLKHLKHLAFLLTNDIATGVLAEIVLPIFREYKLNLFAQKTPQNTSPHSLKFWQKSLSTESPVKSCNLHLIIDSSDNSKDDISKLLYECLNIFAMYLRDIRLIKAFYNEENIKHLEDLLEEPFLIRAVCDLIKIGIDNITFLGDNNQEQNILSRRLITLQFNSSERAQLLFNSLLLKAKNHNNKSAPQFWLFENSLLTTATKSKTLQLKTVDILHLVALQWTLNYELLKTSQYFYNEFAKIYSITKEDHDDEEMQNENDQQSNNSTINTNMSLKPGDKTIIDILQLNYNALTAFLMLQPKRKAKVHKFSAKSKQHNHEINDSQQQHNTSNNDFDSSWEMLDNFINSIHSTEISKSTTTSLLMTSNSSATTTTIFSLYSAQALTTALNVTEFTQQPQHCSNESSFLLQLHQKDTLKLNETALNESITIFDIRNQKHLLNSFKTQETTTTKNTPPATSPSSTTTLYVDTFNYCPADDPKTLTANIAAQVSNDGIIYKLFHIFGSIFSLSRTNSLIDLNKTSDTAKEGGGEYQEEPDIDVDLLPLYETHSDCKKLLLKIFEATMAICIKGYQNEEVEKMQKHLRKLKSVILTNACNNWEQHAEEHSRENTVIQTLQCLLKIAELSNCVNEPAAVVSTSILTSATEDQTNLGEMRPRTRSFNSSRLGGGISYNYHQLSTALPSKNAILTPTTPPQRPLSGESGDADYFSTRASYICADSELEFSENEQDDFYLTADEGYEADGEIQEISETEGVSEVGELWHSFQPSSRYRTHILHEGICRLVVDILIELSQKCCQKPLGWCDNLAQLINRLFVIREYLGGPLFLLKGFAPVLKCHDVRLRELQQCILELIVDLNSPEVLAIFFGILSSKNPPADILVKYMNYICTNTLKKCQPSVELEFPVNIDGKCVSTSDLEVTEHIDRIRNNHLHCQANTPFTRAPCIIPITHARIWNPEGFTISLWLQAKSSQNHKSTSQIIEDDTRSSSDVYMKTHILSVGTNQAMLSIYLNNNLNLTFETFKPNAEIPAKTTQMDESFDLKPNVVINGSQSPEIKVNKNHHHNNHFNQEPIATTSAAAAGVTSPFSKAFKHTKLAFLNSFSNMHIFNGHSETDAYFESTHIDLKQCRLTKNKWTHLSFAVEMLADTLDLCVLIDGLEQHRIVLPFRNIRILTRTHIFQMIALGDGNISRSPNTTTFNESRSTLDCFPIRLSISNLMLFNRALNKKEEILNLTAMGPDFTELTQCHVANWKPNYGYLNASRLQTAYFYSHVDSLKTLRDSRILCYAASQPDMVMCYDTSVELDNITYGHPYGVIHYGELVQNSLPSLQTATILCGGLSNLLYLFARVVEISSNSSTQSMALDILLNMAFSESQLYTEFQRNDYINLIGYVIKTERCTKDCHLLKSIINNACSQPLILKRGDLIQVNDTTVATVVYPKLFISILHRYSDWHRSGAENSDVLDMLFQSILALTREKHPQRDFNIEQFTKEGIMRELLNLCKVYVIESPNPVFISKKAAEAFVNIISVFAGSPPKPCLLDEIMKLMLLLHKPSECYITHDRSKFYFLLTPEIPIKEKSSLSTANFGRVTASFKRNTTKREQQGGAKPLSDLNTNSNSTNSSNSDVDPARQARINRLKKLHKTVSVYRRPLDELEENLENMADCSKLNKNALRLVNPLEASKWRLKFKKSSLLSTPTSPIKHTHTHSPHKTRTLTKMSTFLKQSPQNKRIQRKRIRLNSANSTRSLADGEKHMRTGRRKSDSSLHSLAASMNMDFSECPSLNEVFNSKTNFQQRKSKMLHKTDTYSSVGIAALQSGLLLLLKDFLCLLPDNDIDDVLNHYIKVEFLLVLANHNSACVRSAVIKLISALTQRLFPQDIQVCIRALYPHHLANQLSIGFCDSNMFESCLEWVCGTMGSLDSILSCDIYLPIQNRFGLNALLAIASKSATTSNIQHEFAEKAFKILKHLYLMNSEEQQTIIEAGLIQCCVKALYHLYAKTTAYNTKTEESIADLLTTIGEISLKSIGHINIIWDVINMLSFYQEKQPQNIIKGYRSIQAKLQLNWLNLFFIKTNVPWSFKVCQFPNFSMSETKTRLELLINRCCQFYMVFNEKSTPTQNETELFKLLVSYSIATNQRCNNFIAWGLQPSQPRDLRCFIVDALWISCEDDFMPAIICDGKMIKALLWLSLLEDLDEPIEHLQALCKRLGINENDSTWNLENELQRMDLHKSSEAAKQKTSLEKTIYRFESLTQGCIESSMITTRRVAELQNSERKLLMNHMKDYDDTHTYTKWLEIVRRLTHEGAPWFSEHNSEKSWELDDTEGPSRVHTRLRKCHLDLDKRFFMQEYNESTIISDSCPTTPAKRSEYSRPLDYLISSYDQQLNISLNSQILYNFPAKYLPVDGEIDGEIIVTDHKLYFLATYRCKYFYVNCDISNITEIWLKRYQHQEKAFEIFLDTNQSLFFSLQNQEDWKIMRDVFCDKIVTPPDHSKVLLITQQWREGLLTNWEYLMTLNQIAGRTYNDLMQYPVFPWILSNYTSDVLDLTEPKNFRKLPKPIAVQNEENEQHYINNYTYIQNTMTNMGSIILKPYHYSSHYSNSGTVLHFLVRVPPFTTYFLRYQDNNFDIPDRTFHALSTTYCLASRDSPTDVKELIPEFFCLPEMFENFERFNFGCRQNSERVEDVALPAWCLKDPRLFVLIHRQALESELVRNDLHHWIDLIFGFKQTGEAAVDAINVFHPATYAMFLDSEINDPIEREAVETMVRTYGQMPRQLFKSSHPPSKPLQYQNDKEILSSVRGLRWGIYLGSPQLPEPTLGNTHKLLGAEYLLSFNNTNVVYGLPARSCVMQGAETDTYNVISWGYDDRIVRIQPLNKLHAKPKNLLYNSAFDDITACGCEANSNQLWFGHKSGRISIYKCSSVEANQRTGKSRQSYVKGLKLSYNSAFRKITSKAMDSDGDLTSSTISSNSLNLAEAAVHREGADLTWSGPTVLIRHTDEITCIALSVDFKIAVTAGKDGIAVIWDLNNWTYVRTIERPAEIHHSPITLLTISPTLGDIVTVHSLAQQPPTPLSQSDNNIQEKQNYQSTAAPPPADECFEVTEENLDDFVNVSINPNGKSILRLHSVNARYVQHNVHEDRIMAVCYSYIKEGVGVNVIATAVEGGIVRLWSSWNLNFITEIVTGLSNIRSLTYSTHQHLVVLTEQSHIQVWETKGLCGNSPKFPQIAYK
ncbi:lysosomal-trafficking regulator [Calliphora vicina]|uniref:lysosomal-trafficking regulator n=1 Tax=Calliphora vicina TaxID=7373 RepID=UPI00325AA894